MRIHIIARDIQRHDAVGNFCRQVHEFLCTRGFDAVLVAENCHPDDRASIATLPDIMSCIADDDIILFHFSTEDPSFAAIAALEVASILYFHNITPERFFTGIDERTASLVRLGLEQRPLAAKFDVLMANSRATAEVLHQGFSADGRRRIPETSIIACPPVIGIDRWHDVVEESPAVAVDSRTVLYVGRLVPHKGVSQLIAGFALLAARDQSVRLLCVGGPSESPHAMALRVQIADLESSIRDRIDFLHDISDGALKSIYHSAGACVSMSFHEGFGVPLVDALVFDKPLLINAEAGMVETTDDAAISISYPTPAAIANALAAVLDDAATRERLSIARRVRLQALRDLADGRLILNAVSRAKDLHRARIV